MLRFIQSLFRKTPRPPADCTRIQGAELQVGMVISLHELPWLDRATGRVHSLNYHRNRDSKLLGDAGAVLVTAYLEDSGGHIFGTACVYWDEYVWIYS